MSIRSRLIVTTAAVVLTAWPLATSALAEPDEASGSEAPPLQVGAPLADDFLAVEVPAVPSPLIDLSPSIASPAPTLATLVAAAAEAPIVANSSPAAQAPIVRPPSSGQARRRSAAKSARTRAARSRVGPALVLLNARESPVVSVIVTVADTTVRHTRLVVPNARAKVALPKTSGCTVTVEAVYEDDGASEVRSIDVCRIKLVRLTD